ncbi:MAG TPA: pitrilysin family protein [Candidatus Acidoferrum sp.]|nr:pitrilysin family protein [Candidatus Acidoferrum sp.]
MSQSTARTGRATGVALAVAACLVLLLSLAGTAAAQGKSTELSKVVRLNRAPVNKEVLQVKLPRPEVVKLSNGLTVLLLENHKLPTISVTMWIRPGQLADPKDLPGLAAFTADMLREGTTTRTSDQIATQVDSLGATLDAESDFGVSYTTVAASGLSNTSGQILDLMSDVVLHPTFPADELAKYKERQLADLEQNLSSPGFLAQRAFHRVLYGDFPAAITSATKASIEKVTVEDLRKFHDQHYVPGNAILGVAGDFQSPEMRTLVEKYFGGWSGAAEHEETLPEMPAAQASKITLVDRPGSVQTYIVAGNRGIRRVDPEYFDLAVMNQVLGGGPQSRLFLDLREVHGYTYGSYSRFNADIYPGDWQALAPVRTPVTDGSMTQFLYEFKKINNEAVPQEELGEAQRAIVARFALSLEQPAQILNSWLTVHYFKLPADYWDTYPKHISAVTVSDVQDAAKRFVDLDHMQWICVGDRKQIEDVLKKYGPVAVVDAEGQPEN